MISDLIIHLSGILLPNYVIYTIITYLSNIYKYCLFV